VVIVADLRAMADWLAPQAQQIGERNPTLV
jgi:hypothetical protein